MPFCTIILFAILCAPGDEDVWYPHRGYKAPVVNSDNALSLPDAVRILRDSNDPFELERAALSLCIDGGEVAFRHLREAVLDNTFRSRLGAGNTSYHHSRSRLYRVFCGVAQSGSKDAQILLIDVFHDIGPVQREALVTALRDVTAPTDELLEFLKSLIIDDGQHLSNLSRATLISITDHRSVDYLTDLFGSAESRVRGAILRNLLSFRNNEAVVSVVTNLLRTERLQEEDYSKLVRGLFARTEYEYSGEHGISGAPAPQPPRNEASSDVLQQVLRIANGLFNIDIDADLVDMVRRERAEIIELLESRGVDTDVGAIDIAVKAIAVEAKELLMQSDDPFEVERAALSLCFIGTDEAMDALMECLLNGPRRRKLGNEGLHRVLQKIALMDRGDSEQYILAVARIPSVANNMLTSIAVMSALRDLENVGEDTIDFLVEHASGRYDHEHDYASDYAIDTLEGLNDVRAVCALVQLVLDDLPEGRFRGRIRIHNLREEEAALMAIAEFIQKERIGQNELEFLMWQLFVEDRSGSSYPLSWTNTSADTAVLQQALRIANGASDMRLRLDVLEEVRRSRAVILRILESRGAEIEVGAIEVTLEKEGHTSTPYAGMAILVVATVAVVGVWRLRRWKLTQRSRDAETQG